ADGTEGVAGLALNTPGNGPKEVEVAGLCAFIISNRFTGCRRRRRKAGRRHAASFTLRGHRCSWQNQRAPFIGGAIRIESNVGCWWFARGDAATTVLIEQSEGVCHFVNTHEGCSFDGR